MLHSQTELVLAFLGCGGSCRGLAVLGSWFTGVQHPPRVGAASWATENPRGSSPGSWYWQAHPQWRQIFHCWSELVLAFLGCRGSCRGLAVLGSCSTGVQHLLRTGASGWAAENSRGSSPG